MPEWRRPSWMLALAIVGGCGEATDVARDVVLDTAPTEVTFRTPVSAARGRMALCFEFDRPGESRDVSAFTVVLQDGAGVRASWHGDADRTGESAVCLRGAVPSAHPYTGALITAPRQVLVRRIRWAQPSS